MQECTICKMLSAPQRMKVIRDMLGIDQRNFAKFMSVSVTTFCKMENSELILKDKQRNILKKARISPEWIDYGTGSPFVVDINTVRCNVIGMIE